MSPDIVHLFSDLVSVSGRVTAIHVVWVSSHCGLRLNDKVDRFAAAGTRAPQDGVGLPVQAGKVAIRSSTQYPPPLLNMKMLGDMGQRTNTVILNQLLTGHCPLLSSYLHKIEASPSPDCPLCPGVTEDVDHLLLLCPGRSRSRQQSMSQFKSAHDAIVNDPRGVTRFLQLEKLL